ncbi:hypothetical protein [Kribbella ginsengisoli]|uniref:hypothetical protein n=1 Tax=Kribbella ginsengisoli TaxID=363865 RepID=UPI0031D7A78C
MPTDSRTQLVELTWYDASPTSPVDDWLSLCAQHLPAAKPRRYGTCEPLPHRLGNPTAMTKLIEEDDLVFFSTATPCVGGSFSRSPGIRTTEVSMLAPPLREPELMSAVHDLFVASPQRAPASSPRPRWSPESAGTVGLSGSTKGPSRQCVSTTTRAGSSG